MKNILNEQARQHEFTPGGIHGLYGTSFGAGMYGAFYSPRAQKRHSSGSGLKSQTEAELEMINNTIGEMRDKLSETMKTMVKRVFKMDDKFGKIYEENRRRGTLSEDSRKEVLDRIKDKPSYMTAQDVRDIQRSKQWQDFKEAIGNPKRLLSDLLFGKPDPNTARGIGRRYEDALKQYTKDRMMLDGDNLKEKYGSEKEAKKAIAKDFRNQQKTEREIRITEEEVERRRKAGWEDADINSEKGGKLLDKLNGLLEKYASYDPTNTGRHLEKPVNPNYKPDPNYIPRSERFDSNRTVYKGKERELMPAVFKVNPDRKKAQEQAAEPVVPEPVEPKFVLDKNGRKRDPKTGRFLKEEKVTPEATSAKEVPAKVEHSDHQAWLDEFKNVVGDEADFSPEPVVQELPKVFRKHPDRKADEPIKMESEKVKVVTPGNDSAKALAAEEKKVEDDEKDKRLLEEQEKQTQLLEKISAALALTGKDNLKEMPEGAGGLSEVLKNLTGTLSKLPSMLSSLSGALKGVAKGVAPVAATLAVGEGVMDEANGKKIENAKDIIPEGTLQKLNPFAYAMNGGRYIGNKLNEGYGVASKALGGSGSYGSDIYSALNRDKDKKIDAMLKGSPGPGGAQAAKLKPVAPTKAQEVSQSTTAANDAKAEQSKAPIIVNAPTTVNNSTGGTSVAPTPQGPVRNDESTLSRYVRERYSG